MQGVGGNEHVSIPGHQPGVDVGHVAQVARVHKDHATTGDGSWRGILQVTHLQLGMRHIELPKLASTVQVIAELECSNVTT